ncbi:hypothetical protein [Tychonema sp. LEGE 07203]|uniref:hypothetical protein n=1 Tax=Tychonema sp. LEGE 07203 TaxID=1828671 RepID=UPI001881183A|nr:hypothetical protein [Tychonema sp. LEGE 07203]MBE9097691.1 hypothetical protein [Tychonema sp. LEGE 07203]
MYGSFELKKEEGRRKKEEGRRQKAEGRRQKAEGRKSMVSGFFCGLKSQLSSGVCAEN